MILSFYLSFNNKIILLFIILLLFLKYPSNLDKNKKHFSLERNALTLKFKILFNKNCPLVQQEEAESACTLS